MPNHVTTRIEFEGKKEHVTALLAAIRTEKEDGVMHIDFNKIMPMPEGLNVPAASNTQSAAENALQAPELCGTDFIDALHLSNLKKAESPLELSDEDWENFIQMLQNKRAHGHFTWYSWAKENWKTKWNAYDQELDGNVLKFDTAWSFPGDLMAQLSKTHPHVLLKIVFADEDTGSNCGLLELLAGEAVKEDIAPNYNDQTPEDKKRWTKFAFEARYSGTDPREHGYDDNWEYSEEVYDQWEKEQEAEKTT